MSVNPLPAHKLHSTLPPAKIPWPDSAHIPANRLIKNAQATFQPRAMQALELALKIHSQGYNVYLSGETNLGRSYMLLNWIQPIAAQKPTPDDLVYVHNFSNPDSPLLISLPAGMGSKFRDEITSLLQEIESKLASLLANINFVRQRATLQENFNRQKTDLLQKMTDIALHKGFNLEIDDTGAFTLSPVNTKTDSMQTRLDLKRKGDSLAKNLTELLHKLNRLEDDFHVNEKELEQQAMTQILASVFEPWQDKILNLCPSDKLAAYLETLKKDFLKNTRFFVSDPKDSDEAREMETLATHYAVNLFVDNSSIKGAPVVVEDNPSFSNLLGCIERESEMGALVTDITLIRPGSIHRANGGYLILHMEDLLQHPLAWEGLLRALRGNFARIEDNAEAGDSTVRTKGLQPEKLPLDIKVILIGNEDFYESLLENEERFAKLFKIKAHMGDQIDRTPANIKLYLGQIAQIINEEGLMIFDASALAWLVDLGSHICEDQKKLSLKFPLLKELIIEANALAQLKNMEKVSDEILEEAYANKNYRQNLVQETFMEEYDREMIKVPTQGKAVGQVNGLSITWNGDFEFGLPQKISCTVGVGHEGIIDLEREADLGGPIHTKAMMILKSYLTERFAHKKPLVLSASLYFEQSYAGIEGDSASGAELAALLSSLANVPVRLDLAFTGAVNHSGKIMAVGGVTKKIEGFFRVCARHGLSGTQGVIIPESNIEHLMLSPEILTAVERGVFSVYPVKTIEEALMLLTGIPTGKRNKSGKFTSNSLYDLVDKRLDELGYYAQTAFRKKQKD